jgi:hypothetical protein
MAPSTPESLAQQMFDETDLQADNDQECFVRVVLANGSKLDFLDMYGVMWPDAHVTLRHYDDAPQAHPRVAFKPDAVLYLEHHGKRLHEVPAAPKPGQRPEAAPVPVQELQRPTAGDVERSRKRWAGVAERQGATILPDDLKEAVDTFGKDESPKGRFEPHTAEDAGSDPNMVETPSGAFRTSLPTDEELEAAAQEQKRVVKLGKGHMHRKPPKREIVVKGTLSMFVLLFGFLIGHR